MKSVDVMVSIPAVFLTRVWLVPMTELQQPVGWVERSDTHHRNCNHDGFREVLNPSYGLRLRRPDLEPGKLVR